MLVPRYYRGWNPWAELDQFDRDISRLFGSVPTAGRAPEFPAVNIWTGSDSAVMRAEIPGIDPDKLDVSVQNDTVTLRGSRKREDTGEGETYLRQERQYGEFVRSFTIPFEVDAEKVTATYGNGILELRLPRSEADKPRKIEIQGE